MILRCFDSWPRPPVSFATTPSLKARSLSRSIFGSPNVMPHAGGVLRLADELRDVQQRLRRNAAAIETDAAGIQLRVDERDLHAEIGGVERGGVSAGTGADDYELD